ncbi:hypothetical protein KKG22_03850 [Patescibacteria group bacterium]|nr:hypothetical protein [Patescibacteria group bacterium]MBU1721278.1 hypothetical protein [Patescibacteria group bacterium]MBU1901014.1 hypothetical protein [Patescibacteria group bacterium]
MLLETFFPTLPTTGFTWFVHIIALAGAICLAYAVFIEKEYRQDIIRGLGAFALLGYAIFIKNGLFAFAMGILALASLVEFIEIMLGLHQTEKDHMKKYKHMWRTRAKKQ